MTEVAFIANLPTKGDIVLPDELKDFKFWQDVVNLSTMSSITLDRFKTRAKMLKKIGKDEWSSRAELILARALGYNTYELLLQTVRGSDGSVIYNQRGS